MMFSIAWCSLSQDALGPNFAGAYLVGSFAVGDADIHSDCDFLVATREPISVAQEVAIRRLHRSLPAQDGYWNRHLEGSYPPIEDLRTLDALGRDWLFVDHGHHGTLASKRQALMWAAGELDERWCPLIQRAEAERTRGWDTSDRPDRESLRMTYELAEHATYLVSKGA